MTVTKPIIKDDFISPYELAKLAGIKHPQMVYNYIAWGKLPATRNSTGKWQIAREVAQAFLDKYAPRTHK